MKAAIVCACLFLSMPSMAQDSGKIFVVRHAERQSDAQDSPISEKGEARAECLAQTLQDAHIATVIVSQFQRTKQTAAPLIQASHAKENQIDAKATNQIVGTARSAAKSGNVLIVGHSDTIPKLMTGFGTPPVKIPGTVYDQLFIFDTNEPKNLVLVHYCPTPPDEETPNMMTPTKP